jgi:hypothetical protein
MIVTSTHGLRLLSRTNLILGQTKAMLGGVDTRDVIAEWAAEYGGMFYRPGPAGTGDVCVTDPRAVTHILSHSHVRCMPAVFTFC